MKIFGIDPGSERTGYGCVERSGSRHHLVICGSLSAPARATFPEQLKHIHAGLVGAARRVPAGLRRGREHLPRAQRPQRAEARARARRRAAGGVGGRACRSSSTRRPRSSARWSATAAPRSRRCSRWSSCCSGSTRRRRRTTSPTRWRWRSATCTTRPARSPRRVAGGTGAPRRRRAQLARLPAVVIARLAGTLVEKTPGRVDRRRAGRRLRRAGAAVDVLRASASPARRSRCASTPTCART